MVRLLEEKKSSKRRKKRDFSKMATTISDEFEEAPSVLTTRFCRQLLEEDYINASTRATKQALQELIADLEKNPQAMHKVLRRKREQTLHFHKTIKLKAMKMFKPMNMHTVLPDSQCDEELKNMKKGFISTFNYAQGLSLITVTKAMDQ